MNDDRFFRCRKSSVCGHNSWSTYVLNGGYEKMSTTLASGTVFDAVFCYNDAVALGAMRALHDAGMHLPEDVAVIGIDDINDGRYTTPTLSTIAPDKVAIARLAIESLHRSIDKVPMHQVHHLVGFQTKARESTRGHTKHHATHKDF